MSHVIMKKTLAKALMDAGMEHLDLGGFLGSTPIGAAANSSGLLSGNGIAGQLGMGVNGPALTSQNLTPQINQQYNQQQDVYGQQQSLANQLLQQTQGTGPGQQLIANQAAKNTSQQAALMASQRGASANPAAIARQAAISGQQGQQQSLNAQSQLELESQDALAKQQAQMGNQSLQAQSILQGATAAQNSGNIQGQVATSQANQGIFGGALGGIGGALGLYKGGRVPQKLDVGGPVNDQVGIENFSSPSSGGNSGGSSVQSGMAAGKGLSSVLSELNSGGSIPFNQMLAGGKVSGKAEVKGNSEKNDTEPTLLSPGEVVLPRSVTMAPDMEKKAIEFLKHLKKGKKSDFGDVAKARKLCSGGMA